MSLERTRRLLDRLLGRTAPAPTDPGVEAEVDGRAAVALMEALVAEAAGLGAPAAQDPDTHALLAAVAKRSAEAPSQVSLRDALIDPGDGPRGAVASALGMALGGLRTTAFVSGDDLVMARDLLAQAAAWQVPLVIHAACTAGGGPTRATGDGHHGYHAVADTGVVQLFARNVQDAVDLTLVARRVAEEALVPVLVAMDAEATGRTAMQVRLPSAQAVEAYLGRADAFVDAVGPAQELVFGPRRLRVPRWHDLDRPLHLGGSQGPRSWALTRTARQAFFEGDVARVLDQAFTDFEARFGRALGAVMSEGLKGADVVVVVQGSGAGAARAAAELASEKVAVVELVALRPLPGPKLAEALTGKPHVVVLDREVGSLGLAPPLVREVRGAIDRALENGRFGAETNPGYAAVGEKARPRLHSATWGLGSAPRAQDLVAFIREAVAGRAPASMHLGVDFTPEVGAWPKRKALQDNLRRHFDLQGGLREAEPVPAPSAATGVPGALAQVRPGAATVDGLARFWDQVGALYRGGAEAALSPDPYLGTGAMPVLSGSFRDVSRLRHQFPAIDATKCTGCTACWTSCPDGAVGAAVLSPAALLESGMEAAAARGQRADALRPMVSKLVKAATKRLHEPDVPGRVSEVFEAAFADMTAKSPLPEDRKEGIEAAFAAAMVSLKTQTAAVTRPFWSKPEAEAPGRGGLLVLALSPDACKGCGTCIAECPEDALRSVPEAEVDAAARIEAWRAFEALPDTPGDVITRAEADPEVGTLAASLLSRHSVGLVAGDDCEPGNGERLALRLVLSEAEARRQRAVAGQLAEVNRLRTALADRIRQELAAALPVADLDALSEGLERLGREDADLGALTQKVGAAVDHPRVDAVRLHQLTEAARALADVAYRITDGAQGLGRSRFGVVLAPGGITQALGHFPYNPFGAPVVAAHAGDAARLARGLFEGQLRASQDVLTAMADAEALLALKGKAAFAPTPSGRAFAALSEVERRNVPPVFLVGDEAELGERELGALLALLASERPFKVVVLADPGRRLGPGGGAPAPDLGLLAVAHRRAFVAQSTVAHPKHLGRAVEAALAFEGPALLHVYAPSPARDGLASDHAVRLAVKAVESRVFPLFTYDPRHEGVLGLKLDLSMNPNHGATWVDGPQGPLTPADWLVAQGRFTALWGEAAPGAPTVAQWLALPASQRGGAPMIVDPGGMQRSLPPRFLAAIEAWAQGWRALQELSGSVTPFTGRVRAEAEAALAAKHDAEVAALKASHAAEVAALKQGLEGEVATRVRDRLLSLAGYGRPEAPS
ncbi:MAG: 4Fe-4S binding protein [Myxococcales bacterium]|nr:4Fe-4S binding protein [Myxococcales bacterium]